MRVRMILTVLALIGVSEQAVAKVRLPSARQVSAYVRDNWADYARRIDGEGSTIILVKVKDVVCRERSGVPDCAFKVVVRRADGGQHDQALSSSFEWTADGGLEEIVVLRPRRRAS
jgi:hypothetical protein